MHFTKTWLEQTPAEATSQMFTVSAKTKQPFDLSRSLCSFLLETVLKPEVWNRYYYELFFQDGMVQLGSPITCQRSVFLSDRQDNEALIIIRLSFEMLLDCLDIFFFFLLLLVEIFYSFGKWNGNICNYKPDGKIWYLSNLLRS